MSAPLRRWRAADQADLIWHQWDGEYVFHHALSNDTHRLSETAGIVLQHLVNQGETAAADLALACQIEEEDLVVILSALEKIDFVAWR